MKVAVPPRIPEAAIATHRRGADRFARIGVFPRRIDVSGAHDRGFAIDAEP
jgi:hypothetical protein